MALSVALSSPTSLSETVHELWVIGEIARQYLYCAGKVAGQIVTGKRACLRLLLPEYLFQTLSHKGRFRNPLRAGLLRKLSKKVIRQLHRDCSYIYRVIPAVLLRDTGRVASAETATLCLMSVARNKWKLFGPCMSLVAGLIWLFIALRNFDWFAFLDVYRMQAYRGHPRGFDAFLPFAVASLFLISAALGILNWLRKRDDKREPAITTIFGSELR